MDVFQGFWREIAVKLQMERVAKMGLSKSVDFEFSAPIGLQISAIVAGEKRKIWHIVDFRKKAHGPRY